MSLSSFLDDFLSSSSALPDAGISPAAASTSSTTSAGGNGPAGAASTTSVGKASTPTAASTLSAAAYTPSTTSTSSADSTRSAASTPSASTISTEATSSPDLAATTTATSTSSASITKSATQITNSPTLESHSRCPSSAGTVAGAAIGAGLGVLLLSGLAFFLFYKRASRRATYLAASSQDRSNFDTKFTSDKHTSSFEVTPLQPIQSAGSSTPAWFAAYQLPQAADDATVSYRVRNLLNQIDIHVDNFYSNMPAVAPSTSNTQTLQALTQIDTGAFAAQGSLAAVLITVKTPAAVIKHCLHHLVVSRIMPGQDVASSFLPSDFLVPWAVLDGQRHKQPRDSEHIQAVLHWRYLTSHLLPTNDNEYISKLNDHITRASDTFSTAFANYEDTHKDGRARNENLRKIFQLSAEVGVLLFGHPAGFGLRFGRGKTSGNSLQLISQAPALVKMAGPDGKVLDKELVLVKSMMVEI